MRIGTLCVTALILFVHSVCALDPNKAITQYVHDRWNSDNGLRENAINCILQTRDRYLWFGTFDGLVRFDGVRFTVFNKSNTPILVSNVIAALLEGRDSTLWIGTWDGGLYSVKNGIWKKLTTKDGLSHDTVFALEEDANGTLWIGTLGGGLSSLKDGKIVHYSTRDGLLNENLLDLLDDSRGNLWIATRAGLNLLKDGKFTSYTINDGLSSSNIKSLFEDDEGTLWIGTVEGGLNRLKDGKFTSYSTKEGLSDPYVQSVLRDRDGNVWIATPTGLNRFKDGEITNFSTKQGLTDDSVESLYEDAEGNLWVGTGGGLNRFRDTKFTNFTLEEGLPSSTVWSVFADRSGAVWIGTTGGLSRLADGKVSTYTQSDGLSSNSINVILEDIHGDLWIGTDGAGLDHFSKGKFKAYTTKDGLLSNKPYVLFEDSNGILWIGSGAGLNHFQNGRFTSYTTKDGLPHSVVRAITQDREGNLWIGTYGGLSRFKKGEVNNFTQKDGLANDLVVSLYTDRDGTVWIGTLQGLTRLKNRQFSSFFSKDGLPYETMGSIIDDDAGNLWICGGSGIFSVRKSDMDQFADGKIKRIPSNEYGKLDGIKIGGCKGLQQPTSWKGKDGKLWFAGDRGALAVDLRNNQTNPLAPGVIIEEILADNKPFWSNSIQSDKSTISMRIPPGKERLQFRYTAASLSVPERVKFQFLLQGYDRNWIDGGTQRFVEYTNLKPGNYQFRVKAGNENDVWSKHASVASFYLQPRFYQTIWFYGLCVLAAVAAVFSGYRIRVQHLKAREKELVAAVERGTKDLREANKKLQDAEQRILQMAESGPQALENLPVWSRIVAEDIARVIGAEEISVWKVEDEDVVALVPGSGTPPSLDVIQRASSNMVETKHLLPVKGLSGEIYGALVIQASGRDGWGDPEKNLLAGFAHQLGGALEMERMRRKLAAAEMRKAATIQEMQNQDIAILGVCPACQSCYDLKNETCDMDGAALVTTRVLPYRIGDRYRFARLLGEGGMGIVFQAEDEKLQREVSIKIIHQEHISNPIMRIRLKREAQILAQIQNPGIIDVYDFGELPDGSAFLVMEFLKGCDLAEVLKRDGPGTPQQVAKLLLQIGEALHSTHSRGVIHRDLKPSNLFIVPSGNSFQAKILDFGLAKSIRDEVSLTTTGMVVGTTSYMSPEQARDQLLGEESDLFSLAALTYELLTDKRPFYGDSTFEIVSMILSRQPEPLSVQLKDSPPELDKLFYSALAKHPEARPRSILEWTRRVAGLLHQIPASVRGWKLTD